ncbi:MAG TPA: DUF4147 domain-containing protein [Thermomicrobiales bacterium]|nr:DUF4147 domain-containing protein [Thermomicrobiales bacterium]
MNQLEAGRARIERWFREALKSVDPRASVCRSLTWDGATLSVDGHNVSVEPRSRIVVIAIGKAAPAMARGARDVLDDRIDRGIVLTKTGNLDGEIAGFRAFEASHPTPDERGIAATREIVNAVSGLSADDIVLALISGGGSALLEMPRPGLSLEDLQAVTKTLMHAGAGIHDLNTVRRALSQVKGGGLRQFIGPARCISLLLSDVLGNDAHVIASGPTVPLPVDAGSPVAVLRRFGVASDVPAAVREAVDAWARPETGPDSRDIVSVIADNATMVREIQRIVRDEGLRAGIAWRAYDGDARELGRTLVEATKTAPDDMDVLLGGGEATVEVRGRGKGGRNTEAALVAAMELEPEDRWLIASLASDGDDGMADAAGAIADPWTAERGRHHGFPAGAALADNDSATFFADIGGLVVTGPTGTNVNDIYVAVRMDAGSDREQE